MSYLFAYPSAGINYSATEIQSGRRNKAIITIEEDRPIYDFDKHGKLSFDFEESIEIHISNNGPKVLQFDFMSRNIVTTSLIITAPEIQPTEYPDLRLYIKPGEKYICKINHKGFMSAKRTK